MDTVATPAPSFTAFAGDRLLANAPLSATIAALIGAYHAQPAAVHTLWLFEDASGKNLELDFRGSAADLEAHVRAQMPAGADIAEAPAVKPGPGRPKLGVVAREVTLLPQHWEWLASQPGGASVALRKLVHAAHKAAEAPDRARQSLEAAHRFMLTIGGSLAGFEEASRAMFKGDFSLTKACLDTWPADIKAYANRLVDIAARDAKAATDSPEPN